MVFLILLMLTVVVIIAVAIVGSTSRQREGLARAFQRLARKYHGSYRRIDRYRQVVVFRREGGLYRIAVERNRGWWSGCRIVLEVDGWGPDNTTVSIQPRRIRNFLRRSSVGSGSLGFNLSYVIRGGPRERLENLLSGGVRARMHLVQQAAQTKYFTVSLDQGTFRVERKGILLPYGFLERFCESAIYLCDEMIGVLAVGIDFAAPTEVSIDLQDVCCKVCGEGFDVQEAEIVLCRKCQTPHHKDCWQFSGACSVYGCGEKRYRRSQTPTPVG